MADSVDADRVALLRGPLGWILVVPGLSTYDVVARNRMTGGLSILRSASTFYDAVRIANDMLGKASTSAAAETIEHARATFGKRA